MAFDCRIWSNNELRKFADKYYGDVINVSAWEDKDKEGGYYRDYFVNAKSYQITNYEGDRGLQGDEIKLDLTKDLMPDLIGKYEVVLSHTVLEHIFNIRKAFKNLCLMSRKDVIIVVPNSQSTHFTESYGDYWRLTEIGIRILFEENNFIIKYLSMGGDKDGKYIFAIGGKNK